LHGRSSALELDTTSAGAGRGLAGRRGGAASGTASDGGLEGGAAACCNGDDGCGTGNGDGRDTVAQGRTGGVDNAGWVDGGRGTEHALGLCDGWAAGDGDDLGGQEGGGGWASLTCASRDRSTLRHRGVG